MNMKKSLAGVMAGAMAVSAMATVVSADQDAISLTYDLKTYVRKTNNDSAKVTVVANYEGSEITADSVSKGFITFGADNGYVTPYTIYNKNGVEIGATEPSGSWDWVDDVTVNKAKDSEMVEFEFMARPYKDIPADLEEKYQTFKATSDANNTDGAYYDKNLGGFIYAMKINTTGNDTYGKFDLRKYDLNALGYSVAENAKAAGVTQTDGEHSVYAVRDAVAKLTYKVPNIVTLNKANGWDWDVGANEKGAEAIANNYYNTTLTGEVTMSAEVFAGGFFTSNGSKRGMANSSTHILKWDASVSKIVETDIAKYSWTEDTTNGKVTYTVGNTFLKSAPTTVSVGAFTAGTESEVVWPFKTTLKPSLTTDTYQSGYVKNTGLNENDVVAALKSRKAGNNFYTKPVAVLNDAIANHDNVVFTFTSYNGYVATEKSHLMNQWVNIDQGYDYKTSDYDWYNPTFGQHLYTNLDNAYSLFDSNEYDQYGSFSSAWGINLFTGAVVVNSGLTMQLSDTDTFNWGSNTLSFDWFDITDEGKITDAKTFLTSMLLYTPVDWYWDTLTVVVSDEADEPIDAGEGLDGEGDVIDDETPVEEEVIETEPEVEETEAPAETEAAPVETAPSPATGNAPVALAVIPVALAAAAVVAKKRG